MRTIELVMSDIEDRLSDAAAPPIIGTLAGAAKVVLGGVQGTCGGVVATLFAVPAIFSKKDRCIFKKGVTHLIHGGANIAAGSLEAIPLVGLAIWTVRKFSSLKSSVSIQGYKYISGQENKLVGYASVVAERQRLESSDDSTSDISSPPELKAKRVKWLKDNCKSKKISMAFTSLFEI